MTKIKLWLIMISFGLIAVEKFSTLKMMRANVAVYLQQRIHYIVSNVVMYPKLVLLQNRQQYNLQEENDRLKKQLEAYALQLKQSNNNNQEIKDLDKLQQVNFYTNKYNAIIGKAIIDVNYLINNKLLIDKGSSDGVTIGSAVINSNGVVGQVILVDSTNSVINLVTNADFKIYLQESVTKTKMLAEGSGNNLIGVKYINKNDDVKVGDILYTTGLDNVYPANIPVAKITKIFYENNGFNSAFCEPVVDFNQVRYISILKSEKK